MSGVALRFVVLLCGALLSGAVKAENGALMPGADLRAAVENAADGAVIRLSAGRFAATLRIEGKTLALEGDRGGGTVIEAEYGATNAVTAGPGSRLILRRIALVPTSKLGSAVTGVMLKVEGGTVEAEDVRIEAAVAAVQVENGLARFERATITVPGTGTAVSGAAGAAIELLASLVEAPFGTAVVLKGGDRLAVEGGFGIRGSAGIEVEGGTPDIHIAAADITGTGSDALRMAADGRLTIYGGRLFAKTGALTVTGRVSGIEIEGVSFYADEGRTAVIETTAVPGATVSIVRSRFGLEGRPSLGGKAQFTVRIGGAGRLKFSENIVASHYEAGLLIGPGVVAEMSGNLFAAQWGSLRIGGERSAVATRAELILQPMSDELPGDLDAPTLALMELLAADPDLRKRMRDAAVEAAAGSEEAFDRLGVLAEKARLACSQCGTTLEAEPNP